MLSPWEKLILRAVVCIAIFWALQMFVAYYNN